MRTILYVGKGGVGKTTVAAATGLAIADGGRRALVMSTDRAHSLGDALDRDLGREPEAVAEGLDAVEVDVHWELERNWGEVRQYLRSLFTATGARRIVAEQVAVLPGIEELLGLLRLQEFATEGEYDVVVVDCAPTGATLRLLSLPEVAEWYMRKFFKIERAAVRTMKPLADRVFPVPLPEDGVYATIERLYGALEGLRTLLSDSATTTLRPVTLPEQMAIRETRRLYGSVLLYDLCVDAVVVNRVYPREAGDDFSRGIRQQQEARLQEIEEAFAPLPIAHLQRLPQEAVGMVILRQLAEELAAQLEPAEVLVEGSPVQVRERDGAYVMTMAMSFAERDDVDLLQDGDELVVQVGGIRRNLVLPPVLADREVQRAEMREGRLCIQFGGDE